MSKKVLVISTSLRSGSNSDSLADEFIRGAKKAGCDVEKIKLAGKTIGFCKGCLACQKTHKCVISDDTVEITEKVKSADTLVFSTPIYYYNVSGQMITLLDRLNPLYSSEYQFREVYLLLTSADKEATATEGVEKTMDGWLACFPKAKLTGIVHSGGVNEANDMRNHAELLVKAYNMGLSTLTCFNN